LLAADTDLRQDPAWIVDSTPVECARSRPAVRRSDLAGWAAYGHCASHSRWFWGYLHLACTPAGFPVARALASPRTDERQVLKAIIERDPDLIGDRPDPVVVADKGYVSKDLDKWLTERRVTILRPTYAICGRGPASTSSSPSASSSSQSTTPSKASATTSWIAMLAVADLYVSAGEAAVLRYRNEALRHLSA
jgi:hypothetical protein